MKHKSFSFYRPSAYAVAQVVVDMPLCAIQVLEFGIVVYFMSSKQLFWPYWKLPVLM